MFKFGLRRVCLVPAYRRRLGVPYLVSGIGGFGSLQGLHGTHSASKAFPDPEGCWAPGATGKPILGKTITMVEASLEIPATCSGSIIARTTLRDVVTAGGAADFKDAIRFGVSDGTSAGGLEPATRVVESGNTPGFVEFARTIPWNGQACTAASDLFVYVRYLVGNDVYTFMEIGFYPRVKSSGSGLVDNSLSPAIRLNPCNRLVPIRSPYVHGKESEQFRKLKGDALKKIIQQTNSLFTQETGIARRLDPRKPADRNLANHWLRIRDSVMTNEAR